MELKNWRGRENCSKKTKNKNGFEFKVFPETLYVNSISIQNLKNLFLNAKFICSNQISN